MRWSITLSLVLVVLGLRFLGDPIVSAEYGGGLGAVVIILGVIGLVGTGWRHGFRAVYLDPLRARVHPRLLKTFGAVVALFVIYIAVLLLWPR